MQTSLLLSQRETEVLKLVASELSAREIASKLFISHNTVKSHRKTILRKLKVRNAAGMVRRGFELGLLHSNAAEIISLDFKTEY